MMTRGELLIAAAPYDTRIADAMRVACGVPAREQRAPFTDISGDEYDEYRERLRKAYEFGE